MGSRVIHYCISTILKQEFQINNELFLLGSLAPGVQPSMSKQKKIAHFMRKDDNGIGYVDYYSFYNKYLSKDVTPFNLGYYFHLISDDIWLNDIYYKKIKWLPKDIKTEAKKMYYHDFWKLNGKLIDYYSLELKSFIDIKPTEVDEINYLLLQDLIKDLETDFLMADSAKEESLEILEINEVIQTIEKTVASCIANLKRNKV